VVVAWGEELRCIGPARTRRRAGITSSWPPRSSPTPASSTATSVRSERAPDVALVVGVEPGFEDPEGIIETVPAADRGEGLTAADSAGATQCLERGEGELGLR
jgi:hypothetical protein